MSNAPQLRVKSVETLRDHGDAWRHPEDAIAPNHPFYGVINGAPAPYLPKDGPIFFDLWGQGKTGEELIAELFRLKIVENITHNSPIDDIIRRVNHEVDLRLQEHVFPDKPSERPGACFALVKLLPDGFQIIQCGDCMVFWETSDGSLHQTPNQMETFQVLKHQWRQLMEECGGIRDAAWERYCPYIKEFRAKCANKDYGWLNGDLNLDVCHQSQVNSLSYPKRILICTDGFFRYTERGRDVAEWLFYTARNSGLRGISRYVQTCEDMERGKTHVDYAEKTAILLELACE